jgi:hypothetical protein
MINLAGREDCDRYIRDELERAKIDVVEEGLTDPKYSEVPYSLTGRLGSFTFRRLWYYWAVKGPMPLWMAQELIKHPEGARTVRVAGMAGNDSPEKWAQDGYVMSYHVDSQAGLLLIAQAIQALQD